MRRTRFEWWAVLVVQIVSMPSLAASTAPLRWQPLNEPGSGGWLTSIAVNPHDSNQLIMGGDVLGIGFSQDGGKSWQVGLGLGSWEIADVTWHPSDSKIAWAGTMSGPYVTTDGGRNWQERRRGMPPVADGEYTVPIETVLYDPNNPRRLLAFGGSNRRMTSPGKPAWGSVWESRDSGDKWTLLSMISADRKGRNIVGATYRPGSSDVVYAAVDHAGLFISTDSGKSWKASNTGLPNTNIERVAVHPKEPNSVWVVLGNHKPAGADKFSPGGIFKSINGGGSFASVGKGLNASSDADENFTARYKGLAISPTDPRVIILGETTWNHPCVWRTDDGGGTWRVVALEKKLGILETAYPGGPSATVCAIDPRDSSVCYAGGAEYIIKTTDGGKTWTDVTSEKVGKNAWRGRGFSGLCSIGIRFNPGKAGHAIISAMDAGKLWESTDGLRSWVFHGQAPWPWGGGNDVAFTDSTYVYATTGQFGSNAGILRTTDGKTWKAVRGSEHGLPSPDGGGIATGIHALPNEPKRVWAVVSGRLYASSDAGEKWSVLHEGPDLGWIAADPKQPKRFFVSGANSVYLTEDGLKFRPIGGPRVAGRMACDVKGRLYLAAYRGERGGLWRYADGAWERLRTDGMISNVAVDPIDPNRLAVITNDDPYHDLCRSTGVWISGDAGRSWSRANEGLGVLRGHAIAFDPFDSERVVCGTLGRGYFAARWPKSSVPAGEEKYASTEEDAKYAAALPKAPDTRPARLVVRNGGMTAGLSIPAEWNGKFGECEVTRDTKVFKKGPASLCVTVSGGKNGQAFQSFEAQGGESFGITGWVKSAGKVRVNVAVQSFDEKWTRNNFDQVKFVQDQTDWTEFSKKVSIPAWAARFNILLLVEGDGRAWLDEVHKASSPVDAGKAVDPLVGEPPPKGKPWEPGWGFYPQFPQAWQAMHKSLLERTKKGNADIVFLGDSITQGWGDANSGKPVWDREFEPLKAVNYGVGGDSTRQVLWRIEHGELDRLSPKLVVLAIGTNNLYDDQNAGTEEETAKGIETIVGRLRTKVPGAKILVSALLPRQNEYFCSRIRRINAMIGKLDDGTTVRFLDTYATFAQTENSVKKDLYNKDELHLAGVGYEAWARLLRPLIQEMLK